MKKNHVIRQLHKKSNVTYLYRGYSTYIPGQAYPNVKKKCIGKIDSAGEFEPNKTFLLFSAEEQLETGLVEQPYHPMPRVKKEISDDASNDVVGDIKSITDFNGGKAYRIFKSLEKTKKKIVLRYNHPVGVLLSIDAFAELAQDIEDNALLVEALQRMAKQSKTYSAQEVMEVLGISERELEMVEEDEID